MFAWRKRKPQEEESLVPHGLIWQATEDLMPPRAESIKASVPPEASKVSSPPENPATTKMPVGRVETSITPMSMGNFAPKLEEISEPLPWPSLNAKGALKRPPPAFDEGGFWRTPARQANEGKIVSVPNRPLTEQKSKLIQEAQPAKVIAKREPSGRTLARAITDCKQALGCTLSEGSHALAELYANTKHAYTARQIKKEITQARQEAETRIAHWQANILREKKAVTTDPQTISSVMSATVAAAQNAASRITTKAATAFESSGRVVGSLSARQVRIRIAAGGELIVFFERIEQAQAKWRLAIRRNSRLATSMAMAALSAVLVLGLILLVGRYEPSANAGTRTVTSTERGNPQPANPATRSTIVEPAIIPPVSAENASSAKPSGVVSTALRTPVKSSASKPATARRPHHNEDEDYVARDTYVYYGAKGKQSR